MEGTSEIGRSPQHVIFVATDLSTGGGVNKVIRDLAVMFKRRLGADVTVVNARSERPSAYEFPDDVPVQAHRRQSLLPYFMLLLRLRRSRPDVVVSFWTQDNLLVTLAFLFATTKVVLVEHSSWHHHRAALRLLRRILYPLASNVLVLNRRDLDHYRRYLRDISLIPNPIAAPAKTDAKPREKLILAVGHLEPLKNFEDAVRAMAQSGLEKDGWSLAIIGSGSCEQSLKALITDLGLERTSIHPPTNDLASWYKRASILLVTSRLESFSLVLAEAMQCGVVPLAYASDGPAFILEDFPGQLVRIGDVDGLARHLRDIADDPDPDILRRSVAASIRTRFSPDVIIRQWQDLLSLG